MPALVSLRERGAIGKPEFGGHIRQAQAPLGQQRLGTRLLRGLGQGAKRAALLLQAAFEAALTELQQGGQRRKLRRLARGQGGQMRLHQGRGVKPCAPLLQQLAAQALAHRRRSGIGLRQRLQQRSAWDAQQIFRRAVLHLRTQHTDWCRLGRGRVAQRASTQLQRHAQHIAQQAGAGPHGTLDDKALQRGRNVLGRGKNQQFVLGFGALGNGGKGVGQRQKAPCQAPPVALLIKP